MASSPEPGMSALVLELRDVTKHFPIRGGVVLRRTHGVVRAVDGVSLTVRKGETLSIVGESGSGKTTVARMVLGLETPTSGTIAFPHGGRVQAVFQDPYSSLNPRMTAAAIVAEPLLGGARRGRGEIADRVAAAMKKVGLDHATVGRRYPPMFSGGQRQRLAIARAIVAEPDLIVLDEAVSALDVSIRAQILNLLSDLQQELGVSYLMISHDLPTVRFISTNVAVMLRGRFVEAGATAEIFAAPRHGYTRMLLEASRPRGRLSDADLTAAASFDIRHLEKEPN